MRGRKPKPDGQARHRSKPTHDWIEVPDTPYEGDVPRLPRRNRGWPTRAKRKWAVWSSMPHCRLWTPADWEFANDTLELFAQFHEGNEKLAGEIRAREKVLGTTADYLRDLRIRYVDTTTVEEQASEDVPNIEDFRKRLA